MTSKPFSTPGVASSLPTLETPGQPGLSPARIANGEALRQACELAGSQSALADMVGVMTQQIHRYLSPVSPRFGMLTEGIATAVEAATGVPVERLRGDLLWARVKDPKWPHPGGRPTRDIGREAQMRMRPAVIKARLPRAGSAGKPAQGV